MPAESIIWPSSGYRFLAPDQSGQLGVTDDYLRHLYRRPELEPVEESCAHELQLHAALLAEPDRPVAAAELARLADSDARDNYQVLLDFRELLLQSGTLERAYRRLVSGQVQAPIPPLFADLMAQAIVCHIVAAAASDDGPDAYQLRAGELFFRQQKVALHEGILLADAELLAQRQPAQSISVIQSLIQQAGGMAKDMRATFDVLNSTTAARYLRESESYEWVLSLNLDEHGLPALCRLLEAWVAHFLDTRVRIEPRATIRDEHWRWHIGLDADSNRILNQLYEEQVLDEEDQQRLLALFRLEFVDPSLVRPDIAGYPVYLGLAMNANYECKLKPQNLLLNLPLAEPA